MTYKWFHSNNVPIKERDLSLASLPCLPCLPDCCSTHPVNKDLWSAILLPLKEAPCPLLRGDRHSVKKNMGDETIGARS